MKKLLALMLISLLPAVAGAAQVSIRLIHATSGTGAATKAEPATDAGRLKKAFGYQDYQVMSRHNVTMSDGDIKQFPLIQKLALRLKLLRGAPPSYLMRCELLHDEKTVMETTVTIASGSSYFITGPEYNRGQLLIAVAVK